MTLTPYFSPQSPSLHVFDRKESEDVLAIDVSRRSWSGMDLDYRRQQHAIEFDVDFWPLEHPKEPQDEDRPVKCPMSASSSDNVAAECSRKRSEQPEMVENGIAVAATVTTEPPVRSVRKRHHTVLTRDHHITEPSLPPIPPQTLTVSQMLQQFDQV